jgi:hypothetical protein
MEQGGKEASFIDRYHVQIKRFIIIGMGMALWITIGFHCGSGNPELLNPFCSQPLIPIK